MAKTLTLPEKFDKLEDTLNNEFVERRDLIECAVTAVAGGTTLFMLGPPGTAKSMVPNRLMAYIDGANYFDILMTKFTKDTEVFGPTSLKGLEEDKLIRLVDGYLPWANVAMIDEVFKASSAVLNTLLWMINERKYRNDGKVHKAPLSVLFCASNELPQDESLNALYDRLLFRFLVDDVKDPASFLRVLETKTTLPENPDPILTWAEVEQAQQEVTKIVIPYEVNEAMVDLRSKLKDAGIEPSVRRYMRGLEIVQATAWRDGCDTADVEHLGPLEHVLWMEEEQRVEIQNAVRALANPLELEANQLLADIVALNEQVDSISDDAQRVRVGNEVNARLRRAKKELDALEKRAGGNPRRLRKINIVKERLRTVTDRVLQEIFQFDEAQAAKVRDRD